VPNGGCKSLETGSRTVGPLVAAAESVTAPRPPTRRPAPVDVMWNLENAVTFSPLQFDLISNILTIG
jgi:hypothetical protein